MLRAYWLTRHLSLWGLGRWATCVLQSWLRYIGLQSVSWNYARFTYAKPQVCWEPTGLQGILAYGDWGGKLLVYCNHGLDTSMFNQCLEIMLDSCMLNIKYANSLLAYKASQVLEVLVYCSHGSIHYISTWSMLISCTLAYKIFLSQMKYIFWDCRS